MSDNSENNKRIAKNTLVLYGRMLLTVGISFYTTRLVLQNLGVSDYGLYNIVGGVVSMLYILTTSLTDAISRYLTFGLGKNDEEELRETFSTSLNILLLFSLLVIIIGETAGLWFLNNKLSIDPNRHVEANWVYQFSLVSFIFEMCSIPYNSMIIAHEKMGAFAFVTIVDTLLRFLVALLLVYSPIDKLIFYSILLMFVGISRQIIYMGYSKTHFKECKYQLSINKEKFVPLLSFTGYKLLSVSSTMLATAGVNIVLNMFHGTAINAAKGVASQIQNYVGAFTKNFMIALNPQITKSYAKDNYVRLESLVFRGSIFSYLLMFIIACPVLMDTDYILSAWLKEVPPYTSQFIQYTIIGQLVSTITNNVTTLNNVIGKIKKTEIISFFCYILVLPLSYILLKFHYSPTLTVIIFYIACIISRLFCFWTNKELFPFTFFCYCKNVLPKIMLITLLSIAMVAIIRVQFSPSLSRMLYICVTSTLSISVSAYFCALNKEERNKVILRIKKELGTITTGK